MKTFKWTPNVNHSLEVEDRDCFATKHHVLHVEIHTSLQYEFWLWSHIGLSNVLFASHGANLFPPTIGTSLLHAYSLRVSSFCSLFYPLREWDDHCKHLQWYSLPLPELKTDGVYWAAAFQERVEKKVVQKVCSPFVTANVSHATEKTNGSSIISHCQYVVWKTNEAQWYKTILINAFPPSHPSHSVQMLALHSSANDTAGMSSR